MKTKSFMKRLSEFGFKKVILSYDAFFSILVLFLVGILTNWVILESTAKGILEIFIQVSSALFAIVLAGLAIVTSFIDKQFVYMWKVAGEFDNMITLFQYNLFTPMFILLLSLFIDFIYYNSVLMIIAIALFVYMIFSLISLINFICRYGLQRGEFVKNFIELGREKR